MMNRMQLRDDLVICFNDEEMQALCKRFGVDYGTLSGQTQADRAAVLISKMERQQRLAQLVEELLKERPHLQTRYAAFVAASPDEESKEEQLNWIDEIAGGAGAPIDEPPTMKWDSQVFERPPQRRRES